MRSRLADNPLRWQRLCTAWVCPAATPTLTCAQEPIRAPSRVPVTDFFRSPLLAKPALSPSGRYVAVAEEGERVQLAVLDLKIQVRPKVIAGFNDAYIYSYRWVTDERLVYDAIDNQSVGRAAGARPGGWSTATAVSPGN